MPRAEYDGDWRLPRAHRWGVTLPDRIPGAVTVVAVLLAIAVIFSVLRRRRDRPGLPMAWTAGVVLVSLFYFSLGIPAFYRTVMDNYPVTAAVPAAVAAWALCVVAVVATLFAAPSIAQLTHGRLRLLGVGAAVAVVAASTVTVVAVRAGDDGRRVDATTVAADAIPEAPVALGRHAFTVTVPNAFDRGKNISKSYDIAPAGAGFVVYQAHRITAYGVDGAERWHYMRTDSGNVFVSGMRVFDDGETVLAFVGSATDDFRLIGLDAITGEQLWASTDKRFMEAARGFSGRSLPGPYVVYTADKAQLWTGFDTRTGRETWTVPEPHAECDRREPAVTAASLVVVAECPSGDGTEGFWLTSLDPRTGEIMWDTTMLKGVPQPDERPVEGYASASVTAANRNAVVVEFDGFGVPQTPLYANLADRTTVPLQNGGYVAESHGTSGDFIMWQARADTADELTLIAPDGNPRCRVTGEVNVGITALPRQHVVFSPAYVTMQTGFVVSDVGAGQNQSSLRVFDSSTCAQMERVPVDGEVYGLVSAPGMVLVVRREGLQLEGTAVQIDGYRAA